MAFFTLSQSDLPHSEGKEKLRKKRKKMTKKKKHLTYTHTHTHTYSHRQPLGAEEMFGVCTC
jgi:hypothetical protein